MCQAEMNELCKGVFSSLPSKAFLDLTFSCFPEKYIYLQRLASEDPLQVKRSQIPHELKHITDFGGKLAAHESKDPEFLGQADDLLSLWIDVFSRLIDQHSSNNSTTKHHSFDHHGPLIVKLSTKYAQSRRTIKACNLAITRVISELPKSIHNCRNGLNTDIQNYLFRVYEKAGALSEIKHIKRIFCELCKKFRGHITRYEARHKKDFAWGNLPNQKMTHFIRVMSTFSHSLSVDKVVKTFMDLWFLDIPFDCDTSSNYDQPTFIRDALVLRGGGVNVYRFCKSYAIICKHVYDQNAFISMMCNVIDTAESDVNRQRGLTFMHFCLKHIGRMRWNEVISGTVWQTLLALLHHVGPKLAQEPHLASTHLIVYQILVVMDTLLIYPRKQPWRGIHDNQILTFLIAVTNAIQFKSQFMHFYQILVRVWSNVINEWTELEAPAVKLDQPDVTAALCSLFNEIHSQAVNEPMNLPTFTRGNNDEDEDEDEDEDDSDEDEDHDRDGDGDEDDDDPIDDSIFMESECLAFHEFLDENRCLTTWRIIREKLLSCILATPDEDMKAEVLAQYPDSICVRSLTEPSSSCFNQPSGTITKACVLLNKDIPRAFMEAMLHLCTINSTVEMRDAVFDVIESSPKRIDVCVCFADWIAGLEEVGVVYEDDDDLHLLWKTARCQDLIYKCCLRKAARRTDLRNLFNAAFPNSGLSFPVA